MIGATMQSPKEVDVQGSTKVYKTEWFEQCNPVYRFVVVAQTKAYGDGKQGVITAYQRFK